MFIKRLKGLLNYFKNKGEVAAGKKHDDSAVSNTTTYPNPETAQAAYHKQKNKLLNINEWGLLSGPENADFYLYDSQGNSLLNGHAQLNTFIKIDLPGPLPMYWVKIEKISSDAFVTEILVRPCEDPTSNEATQTKHFFSSETTNTLGISHAANKITAYHLGKNEIANNNKKEAGAYAAINTGVVIGGFMGIQHHQWNTFTKNLSQG